MRNFALLLSALLVSTASAQVLRVPGQFSTIASALSAANSGTTIFVSAGTYKENLRWPSRDGIRLIGVDGPAKVILDGQSKDRVLEMSGNYSRATRIEGITITGGKMTTTRNHGAGLYYAGSGSSGALFRNVHFRGNLSDGTYWNYGAGMHVYRGNPRIEFCVFENNTNQNGSWNYGAGLYIASGGSAEVIGCRFEGNVNRLGSRGYGGGLYVAIGSAPSMIASNLFVKNICQSATWNLGGALATGGTGNVSIAGNTFDSNQVTGGSNSNYGGGLSCGARGGTTTVANNIFVGGMASSGGGVALASTGYALPTLSNNCYHQNKGGNYHQVKAGKGEFSKDPLFRPSSYSLLPASPCIEAGTWHTSFAAILQDIDGQPRRIDGDRDGLLGDGARMDVGADEYSQALLSFSAAPQTGKAVFMDVGGWVGDGYVLFLDFGSGAQSVPPFGEFLLSAPSLLLYSGNAPGRHPFVTPMLPALVGQEVHVQALVIGAGAKLTGAFSNPYRGTIR